MGVEYDVYHNEVYFLFYLICENFMELSNYYDNDVGELYTYVDIYVVDEFSYIGRGIDDHPTQQRSHNQTQTLNTTTRDKRMHSTSINNCNQRSTIDKTHTSDEIIRLLHFLRI